MARAEWNGQVIAETQEYEFVEENVYFPPNSIKKEFFESSTHHTTCPFKGEASYYNIVVNGARNENAAWFYPNPKKGVEHIKDHVAFWKKVNVTISKQ